MIEVVAAGPLTTVQDLGRPGLAALGVGRSGAADRSSHRLANRLVGNAESAATLEVTLGGLVVRCARPVLVALAGAPCALRVGDRPADMAGPVMVPAGQVLRVGTPAVGLRTYLAVRGGIAVTPVLGSRSTDVLSGLGPPAVVAGQQLPVGDAVVHAPVVDHAPQPRWHPRPTLRFLPGPRDDWFTPQALATLRSTAWTVSPHSNRVGVRLEGESLARRVEGELVSEAAVRGSVQVPPSGQPVVFLADHPLTGGYPVIGVLLEDDADRAAQLRPGDEVRLAPVTAT